MEKIPCPQCGEPNFNTSPACWACGAALIGPRAARPVAEPPPAAPEPDAPAAQPATEETLPAEDDGLKPAEREARALREKEYVTPPVDVDEGPRGLAEWVVYGFQAVSQSTTSFKEALDEYDRRRGRKSGAASSYGCVLTAFLAVLAIILIVAVVSYVSSHR